ncbi:MAG TPA: sorbosone dehydrogenase family protein [Thermoanaerobaculia bacterium]|nr:sorbosone dehydrogenase family protein [Thermoanaerobaculia bacterium]
MIRERAATEPRLQPGIAPAEAGAPSLVLFFAFLVCSCFAAEQPPVVAQKNDPLLQHHEVRADKLPAPFETQSAGNPPMVRSRPKDAALHVPAGFHVDLWADGFDDPRNMVNAPNGDIFVAEPGGGKITILRGARPDQRVTFASGLREPFGLAFHGDWLYVGLVDELVRYPYRSGQTTASGRPQHIADLPDGGHSTRNVIISPDGKKLYLAVGSASNVNDETRTPMRAAITEMNPDGSGSRTFASGMRNPVGLAWNPATGGLWTAVNERDGLGDDLVPDYVTEVRSGAFYGWPFSYIGKNIDPRRAGERPDLVAKAIPPSVLLQAHSAALGIAFYNGKMFPAQYRGGLFVAMHGSWNRTQRTGYKVAFVPFHDGKPATGYDDFVAGWSPDPSSRFVWGRPVGLLVMQDGSLLVSDDGAGVIWRVSYR